MNRTLESVNKSALRLESGLWSVTWGMCEQGEWGPPMVLIPDLQKALGELRANPDRFAPFQKGVGIACTYEGLIDFVEHYLLACQNYPEASIAINS